MWTSGSYWGLIKQKYLLNMPTISFLTLLLKQKAVQNSITTVEVI
jgi:hypothetical protein